MFGFLPGSRPKPDGVHLLDYIMIGATSEDEAFRLYSNAITWWRIQPSKLPEQLQRGIDDAENTKQQGQGKTIQVI